MIIWLRSGETAGAGREADRIDDIFPFDITYTVQKSGAPFETFPGTSVVLNLLWANFWRLWNFPGNFNGENYSQP